MQPVSFPTPLGQARIYLYSQNVDMRKSFNGLHAIVQSDFQRDIRLRMTGMIDAGGDEKHGVQRLANLDGSMQRAGAPDAHSAR